MVEWGVVPGLYTPPASLQTPNPSGSGAHRGLEASVDRTRHRRGQAGEQVAQQAGKDASVVRRQLAGVEVPQGPQQDLRRSGGRGLGGVGGWWGAHR